MSPHSHPYSDRFRCPAPCRWLADLDKQMQRVAKGRLGSVSADVALKKHENKYQIEHHATD
jgi:hypothetical protein